MIGDANLTVTPAPRRGLRMRDWWWIAAGVVVLLLLLECVSLRASLYRPIQLEEPEPINVTRATSFTFLAKRLYERKLITNIFAFKVYGRLTGKAGKLKVGAYRVTNGMRPVDVLNMIVSGHAELFAVTIPEGKWASEIPAYLSETWPRAAEAFPSTIRDVERWRLQSPFPIVGASLEGYLFPDTYEFAPGASTDEIVKAMLRRFQQTCWAAYQAHPPKDGRTFTEVLTLASLVEAEAKHDDERAKIAGVYINRLHENPVDYMACDATLLFAEQARKNRVLDRDKLVDSPYNTYKYRGLPPGPINNPGLKSFRAALNPERHNYFYYVARGDGSHLFAHSAGEQSANIRFVRGK